MTPWKLLPLLPIHSVQVAFRELEDGRQESCLVTAEQFKKDILEGAELLDADGQVMQDAIQFVKELP